MSTFHVRNIPICPETRFEVLVRFRGREKGRIILPPSSGHGEGSAGHRTASSCEALKCMLALWVWKSRELRSAVGFKDSKRGVSLPSTYLSTPCHWHVSIHFREGGVGMWRRVEIEQIWWAAGKHQAFSFRRLCHRRIQGMWFNWLTMIAMTGAGGLTSLSLVDWSSRVRDISENYVGVRDSIVKIKRDASIIRHHKKILLRFFNSKSSVQKSFSLIWVLLSTS